MALSTLLGSNSAGTALTTASVLAADEGGIFSMRNGVLVLLVVGLVVFMMWNKRRQM